MHTRVTPKILPHRNQAADSRHPPELRCHCRRIEGLLLALIALHVLGGGDLEDAYLVLASICHATRHHARRSSNGEIVDPIEAELDPVARPPGRASP
jgi:hypothetical protein